MPANRAMRQGIVVGLIAYASVAVFYSIFDFLAARGVLYTVNLLGKAVFRGLRDPGVLGVPIRLDPTAIFWYNALHFVISLAIGPPELANSLGARDRLHAAGQQHGVGREGRHDGVRLVRQPGVAVGLCRGIDGHTILR